MTTVDFKELSKIREEHKDKKIVFCTGSFDLVHAGHILFFEECKKFGDILVVAVGKDSSITKSKGEGRPILNQHIRLRTIDSLKPVDYTYINPLSIEGRRLYTVEHAFENLKPDIYVINEDAFDIPFRQEISRKFNVELKLLPRNAPEEFEGISATRIIQKIRNLPEIGKKGKYKAIFLDRDGVINDDKGKDFIFKKEDLHIIAGTEDALKALKNKGYKLIVITNQPLIARGLASEDEIRELHNHLNNTTGNLIESFYYCPHHPEMHPDVPEHARKYRIKCECRKPLPGMLLKAAKDFDINLKESWMIGDMISDIAAGKAAECKTIMVKSRLNENIIKGEIALDNEIKADYTAENLLAASEIIILNH